MDRALSPEPPVGLPRVVVEAGIEDVDFPCRALGVLGRVGHGANVTKRSFDWEDPVVTPEARSRWVR